MRYGKKEVRRAVDVCDHGNSRGRCEACLAYRVEDAEDSREQISIAEYEIDPEKEATLSQISQELCSRIGTLIHLMKEQVDQMPKQQDRRMFFVRQMKELWKENDGQRAKPRFDLASLAPEFTNTSVIFELMGSEGEIAYTQESSVVRFGLRSLIEAETDEDFEIGSEHVFAQVYHEVTHLLYKGTSIDGQGGGIEGAIKYLMHPGEVRANAKQFAFKYARRFPGEVFDFEKMRSIVESATEKNYFDSFADPEKQKKYAEFGDIAETHRAIVSMTARLLEHLTDHFADERLSV